MDKTRVLLHKEAHSLLVLLSMQVSTYVIYHLCIQNQTRYEHNLHDPNTLASQFSISCVVAGYTN